MAKEEERCKRNMEAGKIRGKELQIYLRQTAIVVCLVVASERAQRHRVALLAMRNVFARCRRRRILTIGEARFEQRLR